MRTHLNIAVLTGALLLTSATAAEAPVQRVNFCYLQCQYQCYITNPGGGPAWEKCYLDCARDQCGRVE